MVGIFLYVNVVYDLKIFGLMIVAIVVSNFLKTTLVVVADSSSHVIT